MTLISSGGFLPVNKLETILTSQTQLIVFSLLMLVSFFSLFFTYNLLVYKKKGFKFIQEDLYLVVYLIITIFLFFLLIDKNFDFGIIFLAITFIGGCAESFYHCFRHQRFSEFLALDKALRRGTQRPPAQPPPVA